MPTMLSVVLSVGLALIVNFILDDPILTAFAGTWGDNLGFYGLILYKDVKSRIERDEKITLVGMLKVIRNMVAEFGPGEYIDSFVIRPALMYAFPQLIGSDAVGIFIAKFAADITFFAPTIIFYEIRKKVFRD